MTVFTRYPLITLIVCAVIVVGLGVGIFFIQITTDPVELWAGPHSRSRQEKDYFDKTFGPFYRTAQIYIKPLKTDYVRYRVLNQLFNNNLTFQKLMLIADYT